VQSKLVQKWNKRLSRGPEIGPEQQDETVGEITGILYEITVTATRHQDGKTTAEVVADTMILDDGTANIVSWQITN
jgi:hypothetical protein